MNRRLLAFLGASTCSLLAILGYSSWERGALPGFQPTAHPTEFKDIDIDDRGVRVAVTAHYPSRIQLSTRAGPRFAFPVFAVGDTGGRVVRLLALSPEGPDPLLGFEDRTLEGRVRPPGMSVPDALKDTLELQGYRFADDYLVLEVFETE